MALDPKDLSRFVPGAGAFGRRAVSRIGVDDDDGNDDGDDDAADEVRGSGKDPEIFTIFTKPTGTNIISAPKTWSRVRLTLTTAGPVVVGTKQALRPVTSGLGIMLVTDVPTELMLPGGSRLYYASAAANRLSVVIEPIPWLEQIAHSISSLKRVFKRR